jgi:putative PEP-CTERM system TPR-repeat lipoprotein
MFLRALGVSGAREPGKTMKYALRTAAAALLYATAASATVPAALAAVNPAASSDFYQRALALIDKKDYSGAVILLKNALQADARDLAARVLLGNTYLRLEDGLSAEKELLRARRDGARETFIVAPLGRAYLLQGKFDLLLQQINTAGHQPDVQAQVHAIRGQAYLAKRLFADSEDAFRAALKILPDLVDAHVGLARVAVARNMLEVAAGHVGNAVRFNPDSAEAWFVHGEVARLTDRNADALADYDKAVAIAPDFHRALLARARILLDRGDFAKAEPDVAKVRREDRRNPEAAYLHALVLTAKKDRDGAREALNEADQILKAYAPDFIRFDPPMLLLAGVVSYFRKDFEAAYAQLSQYHREVPQHAGARKLLAALELSRGHPAPAVDLLEPVARAAPQDFEVQIMLGDALMRSGRVEESAAVLERASAVAPTGTVAVSQIAMLRLASGQEDAAVSNLKNAIAKNPEATSVAMMLAIAQLRRGEPDDALKTAQLVIARDPKNAAAHNLIAGARLGLKDIDGARKAFQAAIAADPKHLPALTNLAKLEVSQGQYEQAYALYDKVLAAEPLNGRIMMALADIDQRRGRSDEAIRWLVKARATSRDRHAASLQLIAAYMGAGKHELAIRAAEGLQAEEPTNIQYIAALGRAYLEGKQLANAAKTFAELSVRAAEQKSAVWVHRAGVWQEQARDANGARDSFEQALSIDPRFIPAQISLFRMDMAANNFASAETRANKVKETVPDSPVGDTLLGDLYMDQKKFADAAAAFGRVMKVAPSPEIAARTYRAMRSARSGEALRFAETWAGARKDDPAVQRLLAIAYAEHGKAPEAIAIYEALLNKAPDDVALMNNLAGLYTRTNTKPERALDLAARAAKAAPLSAAVLDTYGWLLVRQGKTSEGLGFLRNAHLRAPDVPDIRYHMAVALAALGRTADARREVGAALASGIPFDGMEDARALSRKLAP